MEKTTPQLECHQIKLLVPKMGYIYVELFINPPPKETSWSIDKIIGYSPQSDVIQHEEIKQMSTRCFTHHCIQVLKGTWHAPWRKTIINITQLESL